MNGEGNRSAVIRRLIEQELREREARERRDREERERVEEMLRLVPDSYREAALGLGVSRAKTIMSIVLPTAEGGIVTGIVLAMARAGGETAPLILTALGNNFFQFSLTEPMAALPLQIYQYATSPYADWHTKAWGSALVLIVVIGALSLATRVATRQANLR